MATPDSLPSDLPRRFTVSGETFRVEPAGISTVHRDLGRLTVDVRSGDPVRTRGNFVHELVHLVLWDGHLEEALEEALGPGLVEDFVAVFARRLNAIMAENGWEWDFAGGAIGEAVEAAVAEGARC